MERRLCPYGWRPQEFGGGIRPCRRGQSRLKRQDRQKRITVKVSLNGDRGLQYCLPTVQAYEYGVKTRYEIIGFRHQDKLTDYRDFQDNVFFIRGQGRVSGIGEGRIPGHHGDPGFRAVHPPVEGEASPFLLLCPQPYEETYLADPRRYHFIPFGQGVVETFHNHQTGLVKECFGVKGQCGGPGKEGFFLSRAATDCQENE